MRFLQNGCKYKRKIKQRAILTIFFYFTILFPAYSDKLSLQDARILAHSISLELARCFDFIDDIYPAPQLDITIKAMIKSMDFRLSLIISTI